MATELELVFELDLDLELSIVGLQSREQLCWLYVGKRMWRKIASSLVI